jgi:Na+/melibiose symporter-like transporter
VFGGMIDEFKVRLDLTLKAMIAGAIVAFAGMAAFVCGLVILFLWTLQTYGVLHAWGAIAVVFGVVSLFALIPLLASARKRRALARAAERRAAEAEAGRNQKPEWWQDPAMLFTGLQIARTIGLRRLLPILAVGAVIAGVAMSRQPADTGETSVQPAE